MEECITLILYQIGRVVILENNSDHGKVTYKQMTYPPSANDARIQIDSVNSNYSRSLPLLCHYFGHNSWYDFFESSLSYDDIDREGLYKFNV